MKESTKTLIRLSLQVRSVEATYQLFRASFAEPVTKNQVAGVKSAMVRFTAYGKVAAAEAAARNPDASPEEIASARLVERQLATGQYCPVPRAAWLARHGAPA